MEPRYTSGEALTDCFERAMNGIPGLRSSDPGQRLSIYLSDHRAGAAAGLTLAAGTPPAIEGTSSARPFHG